MDNQYSCGESIKSMEATVNSLMTCNKHFTNTLRRLEMKFDRIWSKIDCDDDEYDQKHSMRDVMNKLDSIRRYMIDSSKSNCRTKCPHEIGTSQSHLIKKLIAVIGNVNRNIENVVPEITGHFEQVPKDSRKSIKLLRKIVEIVQDIDQRTIRIEDFRQGQEAMSNCKLNENEPSNGNYENPLLSTTVNEYSDSDNSSSPTNIHESISIKYKSSSTTHESINESSNPNYESSSNTEDIDESSDRYDSPLLTTTINESSSNTETIDDPNNPLSENEFGDSNAETTGSQTSNTETVSTTREFDSKYRNVRRDRERVRSEPQKRNCHELETKTNGIYKFQSMDETSNEGLRFFYERYCDFNTNDNVAWTVIQTRLNNDNGENFNRTWLDYKHGFGKLDGDFWFGNDFIHRLTQEYDMELRITVENVTNGPQYWVEYSSFKVDSEQNNYKLIIGGYRNGFGMESFRHQDNQKFSTYDRENDNNDDLSCASSYGHGWWFNNCPEAVNREYKEVVWENLLGNNFLATTRMMVRPKRATSAKPNTNKKNTQKPKIILYHAQRD